MPNGRRDRHHPVVALLVAVTVLMTAGYAAVAGQAMAAVSSTRRAAIIGERSSNYRNNLAGLSDRTISTALAASPLNQRFVNIAMVRAMDSGRSITPWLMQLRRLGWRDTISLQNELLVAARAFDMAAILNISDALLRRRELTDQIVPTLTLVELDAKLRRRFAARLAARPNWRDLYLTASTGALRAPQQLDARFALLRNLSENGGLDRAEAVANVNVMDASGRHDLAFALWQLTQPSVTRPLNDSRFVQAARSSHNGEERPTPFEWEMLSGEGFGAGASLENGKARMDIDWGGRGVPVFARQRTSGSPGSYLLVVRVAPHKLPELSALTFRLVCDGQDAVVLRDVPAQAGKFATEEPLRCAFPVLEIAGEVQPSATAHQIAIDGMDLRRLPVT